jgi:hypothetical protein
LGNYPSSPSHLGLTLRRNKREDTQWALWLSGTWRSESLLSVDWPWECGLGGMSAGIICLGGLAFGVVALGGLAIGGVALGGLAVGYRSLGGLAIGVHPQGGLAIPWP